MCSINKQKLYLTNILIIDWDDTLFPTTWVNLNSINLIDEKLKNEYRLYFLELDKIVSKFLESFNNACDIYIVTNANIKWIKSCLSILDLTRRVIIHNNIRIVSARDSYSGTHSSATDWKILTFQDILEEILINIIEKIKPNTYLNIISIGDANYEYIALLNLDKYLKSNNLIKNKIENNSFNYLLKSIKFIEKPEFNLIVDQLQTIQSNQEFIINKLEYIDLKFN